MVCPLFPSPEALQGLLEEFVTREGTEYGERDVELETKVAQVWRQLDTGAAVIVYNEDDRSCTILPRDVGQAAALSRVLREQGHLPRPQADRTIATIWSGGSHLVVTL